MDQAFLFNQGEDYMSYRMLGAHPATDGPGFRFAVWAPRAQTVRIAGDFNNWQPRASDAMEKVGSTGIWQGIVPDASVWNRYKFEITGPDGRATLKADPYAFHSETRPADASVLYTTPSFPWTDGAFRASLPTQPAARPINIYEIHLGSWRRNPDGTVLNYRDIARRLSHYVVEMGYTHVELLPVMEHPLDASWGYQVTGYYSATSRYGTPDDFRAFVDIMHASGIGVILDWVPGHFPKDAFGLARFDGTPTFEYEDERIGVHKEWGTLVFDFSKFEVWSFLISNAVFWLEEFHIDGLRVDAVSSMLYRSYGRTEYLPNVFGGAENLEAIAFMRKLNTTVRNRFPFAMMIAEESTAWPGVTAQAAEGGLHFTHKWNMGWMHDTLHYFSRACVHRRWHQDELTFSMTYAFSEHFILAFSHDEVVHGKHSLIDRMPGDIWRKFAGMRALYLYMMTHPGGKLTFMGNEFGQFIEWRAHEELEWFLLGYETHRQLRLFVSHLNHLYLGRSSLWQDDMSWGGFCWHSCSDRDNSVYVYARHAVDSYTIVALNLQPSPLDSYRVGVPDPGEYLVVLDTDDAEYGGSGYPVIPLGAVGITAQPEPVDGFAWSIRINLPPLGGLLIESAAATGGGIVPRPEPEGTVEKDTMDKGRR
ncbi:MAG: 1,4-alpha-glucan branching protein GlgB [Clostridiaceae bacterium]|jgi:1,4-alpha-glucan branching enzyme|nr:1,4-alpha-glucan branching protein GlgB [Clostridiaceae bacterium]